SSSACGVCGATTVESLALDLAPVPAGPPGSPALLPELSGRLRERPRLFGHTGGPHAGGPVSGAPRGPGLLPRGRRPPTPRAHARGGRGGGGLRGGRAPRGAGRPGGGGGRGRLRVRPEGGGGGDPPGRRGGPPEHAGGGARPPVRPDPGRLPPRRPVQRLLS